jgi:DNA-binding NarL/FixJ family response regulator
MTAAPRVLVVDDERFFREAVRDALADLEVGCVLADSGEEALKLAEDPAIEAVVLDVRLPGMSGTEVVRALRESRPALRVIVLSAHTDQELVLEALRLGAADYLAKPIHDEELRLAVQRALEGTRQAARFESLRARVLALADADAQLAGVAEQAPSRLESLAEPAVTALGVVMAAARVSLLVGDRDALRVAAIVGSGLSPDELPLAAAAESVAGLAFGADRVLRIEDIDRDDRCAGRPRRGRYATRQALLAPLAAGGLHCGVLCVADPHSGRPFSDEDEALLRLFAARLGALLAGPSRSHEEVPAPAPRVTPAASPADPEESLRVELLRAACDAMTGEVEPRALLRASLAPISEALRAATSLYEFDPRSGGLVLQSQQEWGGRADREQLPGDQGLTAVALQTGRLISTDRPEEDDRFDAGVDTPADGKLGPLLVLPLVIRGRVLGLVRIHPEREQAASARTGELLAAALSAALRNTLLYRSLLEAVDDVAAARRTSGGSTPGMVE